MTASLGNGIFSPRTHAPPPSEAPVAFPRRILKKGTLLYRAGDPAEAVYRIEEGLLKLGIDVFTGKERIVSVAGPGDVIGALAPDEAAFQENAEALSPEVTVRVISRDALSDGLRDEVFAAAGRQLLRLRDVIEDGELPVSSRLARALLRLGQRFGHLGDDGVVRLTLPLTHDHLAAMIGAARETTTAMLGSMRSDGIIRGTRGNYSFHVGTLTDFAAEAALI